MIYLTYADQPSGVYSSQVIDVCRYLQKEFNEKITLVAFISIHDFKNNRLKIKKGLPGAIVLPMIPRMPAWKFNALIFSVVCYFIASKTVIARNVLACNIALIAKKISPVKKVCFDGRGAMAAEWSEYNVVQNENLKAAIWRLENKAVNQSDYRIAVSNELVSHWGKEFSYQSEQHVVIPCTLNSDFKAGLISSNQVADYRKTNGFLTEDLVMVYSGSAAGWQSFNILENYLVPVLKASEKNKLLFLSENDPNIVKLKQQFPDQVSNKWVPHKEVQMILFSCDYGILIREESVTNRVASPTKFAEYLSAGLSVIISEGIGDYSEFVKKNNCGVVVQKQEPLILKPVSIEDKSRRVRLAEENFTKQSQRKNYLSLIENCRT